MLRRRPTSLCFLFLQHTFSVNSFSLHSAFLSQHLSLSFLHSSCKSIQGKKQTWNQNQPTGIIIIKYNIKLIMLQACKGRWKGVGKQFNPGRGIVLNPGQLILCFNEFGQSIWLNIFYQSCLSTDSRNIKMAQNVNKSLQVDSILDKVS